MHRDKAFETRELDLRVATEVMGWKEGIDFDALDEWEYPYLSRHGSFWSPSTDIKCAWEVAEKMNDDAWRLEIIKTDCGGSTVRFNCNVGVRTRNEVDAETTEMGICFAALAAVGAKVTA